MYKTVQDLTEDEFDELRSNYYWQLADEGQDVLWDIETPYDIPRSVIYEHYEGVMFVSDDFFCNSENGKEDGITV